MRGTCFLMSAILATGCLDAGDDEAPTDEARQAAWYTHASIIAPIAAPDVDVDDVLDVADRCPDAPDDREGLDDTDGCPDP